MATKVKLPNPGSDEALGMGCECPVMDNAHGEGIFYSGSSGPVFWINSNCPLHGCQGEIAIEKEAA